MTAGDISSHELVLRSHFVQKVGGGDDRRADCVDNLGVVPVVFPDDGDCR